MKNFLINTIVSIASFFLSSRKIKTKKNEKIMVNAGCGLRCIPSWLNLDGSPTALFCSKKLTFLNRIMYMFAGSSAHYSFHEFNDIVKKCNLRFSDLRNGIPLKKEAADVIYASHFLEHLNKDDGKTFLHSCFFALKNGGILRIAVPDLDVAFSWYTHGDVERMLDMFFYTSKSYDFHMHKYNYNFSLLKQFLEEVGFKRIEKMSYQKGMCPDIDFLDVYPEHSLYVEAYK